MKKLLERLSDLWDIVVCCFCLLLLSLAGHDGWEE